MQSLSIERPTIAFMTDFGSYDGYVGVMKGVVLGIVSHVQLVDITHLIPPQRVASGAWVLATSYRYFPSGTVFVCVVDPGVGSARRPVAFQAGNWYFVGPDNGLFEYVLSEQRVEAAVVLSNPDFQLRDVSTTFHGRDIFSPAAAHLARGVSLSELGERIEPGTLQRLGYAKPVRAGDTVRAQIAHIDHFGNLATSVPMALLPDLFDARAVRLVIPERGALVTARRRFFADPSAEQNQDAEPFIYGGSSGHLAVAIRNGNAAALLGVQVGDALEITLSRV